MLTLRFPQNGGFPFGFPVNPSQKDTPTGIPFGPQMMGNFAQGSIIPVVFQPMFHGHTLSVGFPTNGHSMEMTL